jgi:hypothetical protein
MFFKEKQANIEDLAREYVEWTRRLESLTIDRPPLQAAVDDLLTRELRGKGDPGALEAARSALGQHDERMSLCARRLEEINEKLQLAVAADLETRHAALEETRRRFREEQSEALRRIGEAMAVIEHFNQCFMSDDRIAIVQIRQSPYGFDGPQYHLPWLAKLREACHQEAERLKVAQPSPLNYLERYQVEVHHLQLAFSTASQGHLTKQLARRAVKRAQGET